ncbi:unnamed protein product [Vicia faba]|uniref:Uncharacterized protein n=1 Tax=Vicia faba TaxID=3906 RepID=A0AAV0YFV7_VICFA|nr:unnamed protein product [Vicia faba]
MRDRDQDQIPLDKGSPKKAHLSRSEASGLATPFLKLLVILHTRILQTPEELVVDIFKEDLNFLHNLHEADKIELLSDVTFYNYWAASLFSLVTGSQSDILAMGNPSKDRDTWKEKCEAIKEEAKIHDSPFNLASRIDELEGYLEAKKKHHQETSIAATEAHSRAYQALNTFSQE